MMRISAHDVIQAVVDDDAGVTYTDILSRAQYRSVARPRQVAMWLMRRHCPHLSYPEIGRRLGGRDHTTVLHGVRKIEDLLLIDPELTHRIVRIETRLAEAGKAAPESRAADTPTGIPFHALCAGYAAVMRQAA